MTTQQLLYLGLVFLAVAGGILGIGMIWLRGGAVRQRLRAVSGDVVIEGEKTSRWGSAVLKVARPIARLAQPAEEEKVSAFRVRFLNAGFRQQGAPAMFFAAKVALTVALPLIFTVVVQLWELKFPGDLGMVLVLVMAAIGYYVPNLVLRRIVANRQLEIFEAFPDALDMIIVCMEAGISLDASIARTAQELGLRSTVVSEELELVGLDLRVGSSRERALRNLATRTGVEEVSMFVAMILQADRFGTSIAESLRIHAEELRVRRQLRAEEAAAKIPLKLLFPLIFCIFPSMLLVLMGPAMIQIYRILLPTMAGQ